MWPRSCSRRSSTTKTGVAHAGRSGTTCLEAGTRTTADVNKGLFARAAKGEQDLCPRAPQGKFAQAAKTHDDAEGRWKEGGTGSNPRSTRRTGRPTSPSSPPPCTTAVATDCARAVADPLHGAVDVTSMLFNKLVADCVIGVEGTLGESHGSGAAVSWGVRALAAAGAPLAAAQVMIRHNRATDLGKDATKDAHGVKVTVAGVGDVGATNTDREKVVDRHVGGTTAGALTMELRDVGETTAESKKGSVSAKKARLRPMLVAAVNAGDILPAHLRAGGSRLDNQNQAASAVSRKVTAPKMDKQAVTTAFGGGSIGFRGTEAMSVLANHSKMWPILNHYQQSAHAAVLGSLTKYAEELESNLAEAAALKAQLASAADETATRAEELAALESRRADIKAEMVKLATDEVNTSTEGELTTELPEKLKNAKNVFDALTKAMWPWVTGHDYDPARAKHGFKSEHRADPAKHHERVKVLCQALIDAGIDGTASYYLHHLVAHEADSRANLDKIYPGCSFSCQQSEHANKLFKQQAISLFYMLNGLKGNTDKTMCTCMIKDRILRLLCFCDAIPKKRGGGGLTD